MKAIWSVLVIPVVAWWVVSGYVGPRLVAGPFEQYADCLATARLMNQQNMTGEYRCRLDDGSLPSALRHP